ncbi:hydroxymethylglutaryl-CoA lyase [Brevibacillus marinus]|uniref:hydroxymethylglutaryl-CoA lyase n=1 Tax=Brevibacillus marinus TaxID=2496837 RepID=UPI000F82B09C|nr:hydroxymethylglutaryl-CoA lyase [Brevibacillus marinus]
MKWPQTVVLKEVGPRDGLQNEKTCIATEDKIAWINQLSRTGLTYIEVTSFVHPQWIPALADAEAVAKGIERVPGITYGALVPNQKGLAKALACDVDEVSIFISASETHNRKNINKSISESLPVLRDVAKEALAAGKSVRGYLSTVFGCPYEGAVSTDQVIRVAAALFDMGIGELSLGDTIGVANPAQVQRVLERILKHFPAERIALHFHDTRGMALANILVSLEQGITRFDAALGGLGGCPYAPGASGNVATDDVVHMFNGMGIHTGIDQEKLLAAARFIQSRLGRKLPSHTLCAAGEAIG